MITAGNVRRAGVAEPFGLTAAEVEERRRRGDVNQTAQRASRSVGSILIRNIVTRFNLLLGALLVAILIIGPIQDALFGLVLIVNTPIGIVQELRAKRVLDRLRLISAPVATVIRDGSHCDIPAAEIVHDDVLVLRLGDQVPVDARIVQTDGLEVDESLLTGESLPAAKNRGEEILSGSLIISGTAVAVATRVGVDSYGSRLTQEVQRFTPVRSEVRRGIDRILLGIAILMVPIGSLLIFSQINANEVAQEAVRSSVAGLVTMVPEGLVLLTSLVFAVAAIRLGARGIVAQELASVEMLARVDVICLDKTGTLTDGHIAVEKSLPIAGVLPGDAIGALASVASNINPTLAAVADAFPDPGWHAHQVVAFSSARKWSGADFGAEGVWIIGAPDAMQLESESDEVRDQTDILVKMGMRVLLAGTARELPVPDSIPRVLPRALLALRERLRADARAIVRYYLDEGLQVKIISGDHPQTVASIADSVDLPGAGRIWQGNSGAQTADFGSIAEANTIFGRVDPHQKRDLVRALQARGHVVAMTGDGVNDCLALKAADIGIALGSGSSAARAVAPLILTADSFSAIPFAINEGRRVIANLERVAAFFLTKTVYAFALSLFVAVRVMPFPLLPRQLSLIGLIVVGIPAFLLSFAPSAERARPHFVERTMRFAVPAGLAAGISSYLSFELIMATGRPVNEARTAAMFVLLGVGLWIVARVARPLNFWKVMMIAGLIALGVVIFVVRLGRLVYGIEIIDGYAWLVTVVVTISAIGLMEIGVRLAQARNEDNDL